MKIAINTVISYDIELNREELNDINNALINYMIQTEFEMDYLTHKRYRKLQDKIQEALNADAENLEENLK